MEPEFVQSLLLDAALDHAHRLSHKNKRKTAYTRPEKSADQSRANSMPIGEVGDTRSNPLERQMKSWLVGLRVKLKGDGSVTFR